ncbi:MAG: class I SAM-dependent methyltransferase [Polyangiales bacterium]
MNENFWNERYRGDEYAYGTEPNDFLREHATAIPEGRVLSLGDGEGRNGVFLATLGHRVTAIDLASEGLRKAERLAAERGVSITTIQGDLATWPFPERAFEGIVAIFCHLPESVRRRAHREAVRALVPGGVFLLEAYTPAQLAFTSGGPKDPALLYRLDALREDLAGLDFEIAREIERDVHEGPFHTGRAATVQIVARAPKGP